MKNSKKVYIQPDVNMYTNCIDAILSSGLGLGAYNINWLVPEGEEENPL